MLLRADELVMRELNVNVRTYFTIHFLNSLLEDVKAHGQQNQAQRIFENVEKVVCKNPLLHRHGRTSSQVSTEISPFSCILAVWILKFISHMAIVWMYAARRRVPPTQINGNGCSFATMARVRGPFSELFFLFFGR